MCFLAVAFLTTGQSLHAAGDTPASPSRTDTTIPVKSTNGKALPVKVEDPNPYKNLHVPAPQSDKYDPRNYSMSQTSSLANKSFSGGALNISKDGGDFTHGQSGFNKSYGQLNSTDTQNANKRYSTSNSSDVRGDSQFGKSYSTGSSGMGSSQSTAFSKTSGEANRTAPMADKSSNVYASNLSKQYLGPGAQHVPDGLVKENVVITHVSDIPNRPLSIDEVRGLINHGFKPDTTVAPDVPTRALNDPDYKPEASPEPASIDDKDSPLPSPGAMAQPPPENTESLPQH